VCHITSASPENEQKGKTSFSSLIGMRKIDFWVFKGISFLPSQFFVKENSTSLRERKCTGFAFLFSFDIFACLLYSLSLPFIRLFTLELVHLFRSQFFCKSISLLFVYTIHFTVSALDLKG